MRTKRDKSRSTTVHPKSGLTILRGEELLVNLRHLLSFRRTRLLTVEPTSFGDHTQAQQILHGGLPATDATNLFLDNAFETAQDVKKVILECSPLEEATIRNTTCVCTCRPLFFSVRKLRSPLSLNCPVSPEVTQGPYYHDAGHLIRQNMAEYQIGIPFVSISDQPVFSLNLPK